MKTNISPEFKGIKTLLESHVAEIRGQTSAQLCRLCVVCFQQRGVALSNF